MFKDFQNFNYCGVFVYAYTNEKDEIKKSMSRPTKTAVGDNKQYFNNVYVKDIGTYKQPNGILIDTSNISTIDIDKPDLCDILDDLKNDCNFYVKSRKGYHFYFNKEETLPRNQQDKKQGIADINLNNLLYVPEYTHIETNDKYNYSIVKNGKLNDMPKYAIMWCKMLLNFSKDNQDNTKIKSSLRQNKETLIIQPDYKLEKFDLKIMKLIYKIFYEKNYFNTYNDWVNVAYMARHLNNSEESFKLFDKYSRKVEKFKKEAEEKNRKIFFGNGKYNINFDENGILIKLSKEDPKNYLRTLQHLYKSRYETIKINNMYIYPNDGENDYIFDDWMKNYKSLCIKSSYGTGKTYGFKKIIDKYKPKKILFITYRQSLAHSFSKDLKEKYNFDIYFDDKKKRIVDINEVITEESDVITEEKKKDNKVYCKTCGREDIYSDCEFCKFYNIKPKEEADEESDVITEEESDVIPEVKQISSIPKGKYIHHDGYTGITEIRDAKEVIIETTREETINIRNSDRLIIQLDSLSKLNNSINMMTQHDGINKYDLIILDEIEGLLNHLSFEKIDQHLIHNILSRLINKAPKVLLLDGDMNDRTYDFIDNMTPNNYKIYENEFKPNIKDFIFSHNLINFDELIDNDLKNKKKIVIVSMTATDSEKYNDKYKSKYKVIIHNGREKNKNILLDVNSEWSKADLLIYSPSVESGVDYNIVNYFYKCYSILSDCSTSYRAFCQMLNRVRYYENNEIMCLMPINMEWKINQILYRYDEIKLTKYNNIEINNLVNILIHNDTEKINSNNYFICALINALVKKGHNYKYLDDKPLKRNKTDEKTQTDIIKENIVNAEDICDEQYDFLLKQARQNKDITRAENNNITKKYYKKVFKIDTIDKEFIDTHYNKIHIVKNFKMFNVKLDERREKIPTQYLKNFKWDKIDKLKTMLKTIGYTVENNEIIKNNKIEFDTIKLELEKTLTNKDFRILFNCKREVKKINILDITNDILLNYGLQIEKKRFKHRKDGQETYFYETDMKHIKIMSDFVERERILNNNKFVDIVDFID